MRTLATIAVLLATAAAPILALADSPRECALVPAPTGAAVAPWRKGGPYAAGLRLLDAGKAGPTARSLVAAWEKVRKDLAPVFVTDTCGADRIRATLARTVLARPPLAVPVEDRFLPPPPIVDAVAWARCASGDVAGAADWLVATALQGDDAARAVAAVLLAASKRPDAGLALLPAGNGAATTLARACILARTGRPDTARKIAPARPAEDAPAVERALAALLDAWLEKAP